MSEGKRCPLHSNPLLSIGSDMAKPVPVPSAEPDYWPRRVGVGLVQLF